MRKVEIISIMSTWAETYELLVSNIEATYSDRKDGADYIKQAMYVITDLNIGDELAYEASIQLSYVLWDFYLWILWHWKIDQERMRLIYRINVFTETYKGDLTNFVNNEVPWPDGCVPYNWAEDSGRAVDTSEWNVCS